MTSPNISSSSTGSSRQGGRSEDEKTRDVQHTFVNCRLQALNNPENIKALREETLAALRVDFPFQGKLAVEHIRYLFTILTTRLQKARLTINFAADAWFMTENTYPSYTQVYERAMKTGKWDETRNNADEVVTFPDTWPPAPVPSSPRLTSSPLPAEKRAKLTHTGGAGSRTVDALRQHGLAGKMKAGDWRDISSPGGDRIPYPGNPQFDPRTRQVFAAVDYGRRPHGAAPFYGFSFLVLANRFKTNALYFAGDTYRALGGDTSAANQLSFDLLGALYHYAKRDGLNLLLQDLRTSCIHGMRLPDVKLTLQMELLVEAHLFEPVAFDEKAIEELHLSRTTRQGGDYPPDVWDKLVTNAEKFCKAHGCRLVKID